ncbi:MAG: hypothetical protein ABIJ56_17785 [Pseudomonadota bacterium]
MKTPLFSLAIICFSLLHLGCEVTVGTCGNGICGSGESCYSCAEDCGVCTDCGNGICEGGESCYSCPGDCGQCMDCGNGVYEAGENCSSCPDDCGTCTPVCGDGSCDAPESCWSCAGDCGACPGDAAVSFAWTIGGLPANYGVCAGVGAGTVQIWFDETGNDRTDRFYEFDCEDGSGATPEDFASGHIVKYAFALYDRSGSILTQSDGWSTLALSAGLNDLGTVDFTYTPPHDAAVSFAWSIHFLEGDATLCGAVGAAAVQLWLDETGDDETDRVVEFDCSYGAGTSGLIFDSGEDIKYAFGLYDGGGDLLSQTGEWAYETLSAGDNDLGEVNFIVGDYGPLSVDLQWADAVESASHGDCDFPPATVSAMGYLLCMGELDGGECPAGSLYDEVDIDTAPVECRENLTWDLLDFGTFTLVVDGEDEIGTTLWGLECLDLLVDEFDPGSNEYICQVQMTQTP